MNRFNNFLQIAADIALVMLAWWIAFWLRFNLDIPEEFERLAWRSMPWVISGYGVSWILTGLHRQVWRYTGLPELRQIALAVLLSAALVAAMILMLRYKNFPRSVMVLHPLVVVVLLAAIRAAWRSLRERSETSASGQPLLIFGNLHDASDALRALKGSSQWQTVGIVSPSAVEVGRSLQGIAVLSTVNSIAEWAIKKGATTVLIASPSGSDERREVLLQSSQARLTLLTMPRPDEWLRASVGGLRRIEIEDLLGRDSVHLDVQTLAELFSGKTVLVSGAGGSIGSELCRQIARLGVARLVCIDTSEIAIYKLEHELRHAYQQMQGLYFTANIRELDRIRTIAMAYKPTVVFHAAAYKHVPLMETHNEIEAVRTNIVGTLNVARVAGACGSKKFVLISTDKAVNPTNVMGATKRMAELVVQSIAQECTATEFVSVRFGNVLGSSGSVVPLFTEQIAKGGPVTVTHPDIVRYFMTIPEAARLVLQAGLMGQSGQIYVLDMGEPIKIADLARMMIRLSGKTEQEVPLSFTGLRPGEKLYEELLADDETTEPTPHPKLRIAKTSGLQAVNIQQVLDWVDRAGPAPTSADVRTWLRSHLPEYKSPA